MMSIADRLRELALELDAAAKQLDEENKDTSVIEHGIQPIAIYTNVDGDGVFDTSSVRAVIAKGDVEAWAWSSLSKDPIPPWKFPQFIFEIPKSDGEMFSFVSAGGDPRAIKTIWTRKNGVWSEAWQMPPYGGFNSDGS